MSSDTESQSPRPMLTRHQRDSVAHSEDGSPTGTLGRVDSPVGRIRSRTLRARTRCKSLTALLSWAGVGKSLAFILIYDAFLTPFLFLCASVLGHLGAGVLAPRCLSVYAVMATVELVLLFVLLWEAAAVNVWVVMVTSALLGVNSAVVRSALATEAVLLTMQRRHWPLVQQRNAQDAVGLHTINLVIWALEFAAVFVALVVRTCGGWGGIQEPVLGVLHAHQGEFSGLSAAIE